jgi:hypothetical protein
VHTNLLIALANIIENPITDLVAHYQGSNRANNMGAALETYIKDIFCHSINQTNDIVHSDFFSYLGNQNNPPDMVIRDGDAIEVKKIENPTSALALNSSYPKDKLHYDDSRITDYCRQCDFPNSWQEKDIIYVIGVAPKNSNKLSALWFVYGTCYAADRRIYKRVADKISQGIEEIPDVEFIETNELAKVKKVDPLGITDLRVRGMWHIDNPLKVFKEFVSSNKSSFNVHAILLKDKYDAFPPADISRLENLQNPNLSISNIKIKSPNNPAQRLEAKLISYVQ